MGVSTLSPGDTSVCEQAALIPHGTFQVSYRFAPRQFASRLLALRAFLVRISSIPAEVSEPAVGLAKLSWWRNELGGEALRTTQHPVARALRDSGVLFDIDGELLEGYFSAVAGFMSTETYEDEPALFDLAMGIGGHEALMETAQDGHPQQPGAAAKIGAGSFLYRAVIRPGLRKCQDAWWVPLNLQARHGAEIRSTHTGRWPKDWEDLVNALCATAREWLDQGLGEMGSCLPPVCHHLVINAELKRRRLVRILRNPGRDLEWSLRSSSIGDVWATWRLARRLRRTMP
jgi:phytoene synthase